jgi:hypothetical protein
MVNVKVMAFVRSIGFLQKEKRKQKGQEEQKKQKLFAVLALLAFFASPVPFH